MAVAAPFSTRFSAHLRAEGWIRPGDRILVALSGGLDSVCLLHLLRATSPLPPYELHAAHFDHALRPGSARDAEWVRGLCRAWSVPLQHARAPVAPRSEAEARVLRYAFLERAADEIGARWIATAHHADDQLETLLFRLARGTGLRGLRGIPGRRGRIVRPLLPFRRAELSAYARAARLRWREDESNRWRTIARNRIRSSVLPALEARWPDAAPRLLQLAAVAQALDAAWQAVLPGVLQAVVAERGEGRRVLARGVLREYHPQTRARVMRELARQLGTTLSRAGTRAALRFIESAASGAEMRPGPRLRLSREFDRLVLGHTTGIAAEDLPVCIETADAGTGRARIGGTWYDVSWGPLPSPVAATGPSASFDAAELRFPLELRRWRPGDRIRLAYGTKKLKKLLAERRVPRSRRATLPVLAEQAGTAGVLWVAGIARAARGEGGNERWHITVDHGESA